MIAKAHTPQQAQFQANHLARIIDEYGDLSSLTTEQCDIVVYNLRTAAENWRVSQAIEEPNESLWECKDHGLSDKQKCHKCVAVEKF